QGISHLYEAYPLTDVTFPIRVLSRLGVGAAILTNAAGGIAPEMTPGCLMVFDDHLNLQGTNPLIGRNDERFGPRFPDMADCYHERYRIFTLKYGHRLGIPMFEGTYAALTGPSYETAAEIRMLRTLGADAVGMSTVPEAIAARQMGMQVIGISCITNLASGVVADQPIDHSEVLETGAEVRVAFTELLRRIIRRLGQ